MTSKKELAKIRHRDEERIRRLTPEFKAWKERYYQRPEVKERARRYAQNYYHNPDHKERIREYQKRRYEDPAFRERARQAAKEYKRDHPEYGVVQDARRAFKELIRFNPEEANRIVSEVIAEEGPNFKEILLDGIPEKLLRGNQ